MKQQHLLYYLFFIFLFFFSAAVSAQKKAPIWIKTTKAETFLKQPLYQQNEPAVVNYYKLNLENLKSLLRNAPERGTSASNVVLSFPTIEGKLESFRIEEASNMAKELQAEYPEIRSYIGYGITNPRAVLRFSLSPQKGLSSMVLSDKNTVFIEPYSQDLSTYRVYINSEMDVVAHQFVCETEYLEHNNDFDEAIEIANRNANDGKLRTFRLALACTGEYATFHGGTVQGVIAAMNTSMTRINGVYERDMAIRMVIVPNNSNVIFLNAETDPYTNNDGVAMLSENQSACNSFIGSTNYDIGHVFSTGGGGVAQLNSPCTSSKARGVTGSPTPVGDAFDIDFVAHEMGHQFGANHTQNNNCQRSAKSFEPGSASTIMGYAGICPPNVQNSSDDYFHRESIREMWLNISAGASQCATQSNTNNSAPIAFAGADFTIPRSTPFILKGAAVDANAGNTLTYCWEQMDATPAPMPPVSSSTVGPAFRSLYPTTSSNRYMPALPTVLSGSTSSTWEVVPSVGRTMNFNLTVRDNVPGGASTSSDAMVVTTAGNAGPFIVTSQNSNVTWQVGSNQTITWDVADTNVAPVNTPNVNILLSTNGGTSFPIVLASGVPNTGSFSITVPNNVTNQARIMIEGAGNIFYNINSSNFQIMTMEFVMNVSNPVINVCQPNNAVYNFTYNTIGGFAETTTFSATGVPAGGNVAFSPPTASSNGTDVTMTISNTVSIAPGTYSITVVGTAASTTKTTIVTLNVYSTTLAAATLTSPVNGDTDVSESPTLTWNLNSNVQEYFVQVATDSGFLNIVNSATVTTPSYVASLSPNTLYYWRVISSNQCATASSSVFRFTTANIICSTYTATDTPIVISASGSNLSYTSTINIPGSFIINDINVKINIDHTYVSDLDITLTSPSGTVVLLTSNNGVDGAEDYTNTIFDQEATTPITEGAAPFTGSFIPEESLAALYGQMSNGNWTLTVEDLLDQDGGTISEFTIDLCTKDINEEYSFIIFPNPNKGEFTIKFNSTSNSDIKVDVFDIRGRMIFNNSYKNNPQFNQSINLNNAQSGMYLVRVFDGDRQLMKKIIVN